MPDVKRQKVNNRKTADWNNCRRKLKKESLKTGLTFCQFQFEGCWGTADGYSHPKKRNLTKREELGELAILSCNFCHQIAENADNKLELHQQAFDNQEFYRTLGA